MRKKTYFFCGAGGSGMSALGLILARQGHRVLGSDRARDQGQSPQKFSDLESKGIKLFPQDGSGITNEIDFLVVSAAVEDSIPDVKAAKDQNIPIIKRAELLAGLFNDAKISIAVAGTSGKSTVTGMIATILESAGLDPTVMNGGMIRNFEANMRVGQGDIFIAETDESDGTIALYNPSIAVLNNVALDHKSMEELDSLFGDFVARTSTAVILNADDPRSFALKDKAGVPVISYSTKGKAADLQATDIKFLVDGTEFKLQNHTARLRQPGEHNISNALAALGAAKALGVPLDQAIKGLQKFTGIGRRMEVVGTKSGIAVIDDFGHNPDKIAATLRTLKNFPGRLIVMFQPHGFGPLKLMGREIADTFIEFLGNDDVLLMPEAYYAGGTADRSVTAQHVIAMVAEKRKAQWFENRKEIAEFIKVNAKQGDRIIIMGARDDTLSDFARDILKSV